MRELLSMLGADLSIHCFRVSQCSVRNVTNSSVSQGDLWLLTGTLEGSGRHCLVSLG